MGLFAQLPDVLSDVLSELRVLDGERLEVGRLPIWVVDVHPFIKCHCVSENIIINIYLHFFKQPGSKTEIFSELNGLFKKTIWFHYYDHELETSQVKLLRLRNGHTIIYLHFFKQQGSET
jgi:hypothetical protein